MLMSFDWSSLFQSPVFLVAFGWALSTATQYLTGIQSAKMNFALARAQRRYEVGREAYKGAIAALDMASDVIMRRREPSPEEAYALVGRYYEAIGDARITFGLPVTPEVTAELIKAFFIVPTTVERGGDVDASQSTALEIVKRHRDELTIEWHRIIHGGEEGSDNLRREDKSEGAVRTRGP